MTIIVTPASLIKDKILHWILEGRPRKAFGLFLATTWDLPTFTGGVTAKGLRPLHGVAPPGQPLPSIDRALPYSAKTFLKLWGKTHDEN